jgi:hydroxyacylglutathione hydrolase
LDAGGGLLPAIAMVAAMIAKPTSGNINVRASRGRVERFIGNYTSADSSSVQVFAESPDRGGDREWLSLRTRGSYPRGMRIFVVALLAACSGPSPSPGADDAPRGDDAAITGDAGELIPGTLEVSWMHGSASCAQNTDPELQVHAYNTTTHIIRQNKCRTFEAPFIYVLAGTESALVLDTGATTTATLRDTVRALVGSRPLIVAHSHGHGDHRASDAQFAGQPLTTVIAPNRAAVEAAFGIASWPTSPGLLELGDRAIEVLAIPGHEATHIALYDRQTGLLFTGDSLYPGLLFISSWTEYCASIRRLADFVASRPIAHVLGAHIEMTATPGVSYPYRTTYQPDEHVLQLAAAHVAELDAALTALGPTPPPAPVVRDDFVIVP